MIIISSSLITFPAMAREREREKKRERDLRDSFNGVEELLKACAVGDALSLLRLMCTSCLGY